MLRQRLIDARLIAEKNETQRRLPLERKRGSRNQNLRSVVAAHCVDCDCLLARHARRPAKTRVRRNIPPDSILNLF